MILQTVLIILAVLAAIVVLLLIVVALQPSAFRVARSTKIAATPAAVFEHVNDFRKWNAWNPWGKIDPAMKQTYEGAPAGQGAKYSWVGNKDVGEGRMTIVESRPGNLVRIDMQFIKRLLDDHCSSISDHSAAIWALLMFESFLGNVHLKSSASSGRKRQLGERLARIDAAASPTAMSS